MKRARAPRPRKPRASRRITIGRTVPAAEQVSDALRETWTPYRSEIHRHYGTAYQPEPTREA